ncbi:MAG TPA: hypothetical protein VHW71_18695 [Steroidobacteraceae bacterium]|jgi:hypothetical protein|nr:hypothetical protein [Steroidobacteraceae bacterium]
MKLFSKSKAPTAAPTKQARKGVTCGELAAAIKAVSAEAIDWTTRKTIQALDALLPDGAKDEDIVSLDGPAPVSLAKFDEALADLDKYDLPAGTLSSLKRLRVLFAQAADAPVPRAEFDALVDAFAIVVSNIDAAHDRLGYPDAKLSFRLERIVQASDEFKVSNAQRSMLQRITGHASRASENNGARERKRAGSRLNVVPGGGGLGNF